MTHINKVVISYVKRWFFLSFSYYW